MPFKMLGSQFYILDEICAGLEEGLTKSSSSSKADSSGSSTLFLLIDLFWAFEHPGMLGVFLIAPREGSREDFRTAIDVFFSETPKGFLVKYTHHNRNMLVLEERLEIPLSGRRHI